MIWAIQNINDPELFWFNSFGWGEGEFDLFSDEEKAALSLPIEGQWIAI